MGGGVTVTGPTTQAARAGYYGIYFRGSQGSKVKNVKVTNFEHCVAFEAAESNELDGTELYGCGSSATYGYGIHVWEKSRLNSINNNNIHNNEDEGLHLGDAHTNIFSGNTFSNNDNEQINLYLSDDNTFSKNTTSGGTTSLYLVDSKENTFSENDFSVKAVQLRNDSSDNFLSDNSYKLIKFELVSGVLAPANNTVVGGSFTNGGTCITFTNAVGNVIEDVTFSGCGDDVSATGTSTNYLYEFDPLRMGKTLVASGAQLDIGWYLRVFVNDSSGVPIDGATVEVRDKNSALVYSTTTNSDGTIDPPTIREKYKTTSGVTYSTPIRVKVIKAGYTTYDEEVPSFTAETDVNVTLS